MVYHRQGAMTLILAIRRIQLKSEPLDQAVRLMCFITSEGGMLLPGVVNIRQGCHQDQYMMRIKGRSYIPHINL